jgi:hypothetical protein
MPQFLFRVDLPREETDGKARPCEGPAEEKIFPPEIDKIWDGAGTYEENWTTRQSGRRDFSSQQNVGVRFGLVPEFQKALSLSFFKKSIGVTSAHGIGL